MAGEMAKEFAPADRPSRRRRHGLRSSRPDATTDCRRRSATPARAKASQTAVPCGPADKVSTRNLTPYCELTEQPTAPMTAVRIAACAIEPPAHIAQQEGNRPFRVVTEAIHPPRSQRLPPTFVTPAHGNATVTKKGPAACRPYFASSALIACRGGSLVSARRLAIASCSSRGGRFYAYRADCTVDRGDSPETLWRHRARRFLADGGAGGARPRCHAVRQRQFGDGGQARADVAARAPPRRYGARSHGAAYLDARAACAASASEFDILHFHLDYFPFSVFSRQSTPFITTMHGRLDLQEHQTVFNAFSVGARRVDLERTARAGATGALAAHGLSRPAGAACCGRAP